MLLGIAGANRELGALQQRPVRIGQPRPLGDPDGVLGDTGTPAADGLADVAERQTARLTPPDVTVGGDDGTHGHRLTGSRQTRQVTDAPQPVAVESVEDPLQQR